MSRPPPVSGRGGGLRLRKGQVTSVKRGQKRDDNMSVTFASGTVYANLNSGPIPNLHTATTDQYVSYCLLERRNIKTSQSVWLKNVITLIRGADPHAAIIPYDITTKVNPITHANQVPTTKPELEKYFPRMYMNAGKMTTKCKMSTSVPIKEIKWTIMPQLQSASYYITPTQLKALRTGKAGYFLYGHPELTFRNEFQTVLKPLINDQFGRDIEFQVAPEVETIVIGQKRTSQRVIMVRCPLPEVENIRAFFSEAFSEDSVYDVGYLARYTFVTTHPVGECTKNHLRQILKCQQDFHRSIHYYIMYGVDNLDTLFPSLPNHTAQSSEEAELQPPCQAKDRSHPPVNLDGTITQPNAVTEDMDMDTGESLPASGTIPHQDHIQHTENVNPSQEKVSQSTPAEERDSPIPTMSLRLLLYLCQSKYGNNLFHAVYKSTEDKKIYVLCTQENMQEALKMLHNLREALSLYIGDEDIAKILVSHNGQSTYVKDFPKVTGHYASYANSLVSMTSSSNPQSEDQDNHIDLTSADPFVTHKSYAQVSHPSHTPRTPTAKRFRDGSSARIIPVTPQTNSRLPPNFVQDTSHDKLNATVTESIARMKNLETSHSQLSSTLQVYGNDISTMSSSISNNSKAIKNIQEAQTAQQKTIETIAATQQQTLSIVNSIADFNEKFVRPLVQTPDGDRGAQP